MRTRVDKRRSGKIADRKTRREERKREKKKGRLKMKGEAGTISDLVYVLYEKRAKRGEGLVAPRRPSRCQSDREIGEIV